MYLLIILFCHKIAIQFHSSLYDQRRCEFHPVIILGRSMQARGIFIFNKFKRTNEWQEFDCNVPFDVTIKSMKQ